MSEFGTDSELQYVVNCRVCLCSRCVGIKIWSCDSYSAQLRFPTLRETMASHLLLSLLVLLSCAFSAARDGPMKKGRTPVMGWNTWCTQNACTTDWCSSSEVLDVAKAIKELSRS